MKKSRPTGKPLVLILAACVSVSTSGCASMFSPGPDHVMVSSRPEGADVWLDDEPVGRTPVIVPVERGSDGRFRLEMEGHPPLEVDRNKVVNGLTFLNLLLPLWPLWFAVDAVAGNIGKYSVKPLIVVFDEGGPRVVEPKKRKPAAPPREKRRRIGKP